MSSPAETPPRVVTTIGYEGTTMGEFLDALRDDGVQLLVDVRAVASSRRPGFAKTRLAANLEEAGIDYVHLRGLGTPADGRSAARKGRHDEMHRIFSAHLVTDAAEADMHALVELVQGSRRTCLMCFEADPRHCHRSIVAAALAQRLPIDVRHLTVAMEAHD